MLPKKKRVTKNTFKTVLKEGSVVYGSFFVFRYIKQDFPSYAFVVPKKLVKTAVKRNLLRRKGYNIIRKYPLKSMVGIFFYKKEGLLATKEELLLDIENILKRASVVK